MDYALSLIVKNVKHYLNLSDRQEEEAKYSVRSPVECHTLKYLAYYCMLLLLVSLVSNVSLIVLYMQNKRLRNPLNSFIIAIITLNLVGSLIELPIVTLSNYNCQWFLGKAGCFVSGFVMYFIGCASIFLMMAISFERLYIIYCPMNIKLISLRTSLLTIAICLLFGFLWAAFPLVGWSRYSLEGALTSCSVEWNERSLNVISYNVAMFLFVYIVPLIVLVATNIKLIQIVRSFQTNSFKIYYVILNFMRKKKSSKNCPN